MFRQGFNKFAPAGIAMGAGVMSGAAFASVQADSKPNLDKVKDEVSARIISDFKVAHKH
jgi:hypothetical protein